MAYKETITTVARTEYKHKKQTGGHGQYGHVMLRLEPLDRTEGFQFGTEVVGGSVPREYFPAVEKGVMKTLSEGVVAGYPVVDMKVVLYDGSFHDVDSSGISFEIAASHALRKGVNDANPLLLEPVVSLRVLVPDTVTGDVMGDMNGRRGRISGMTPQSGGQTLIEAEVPQAEVLRYATELRSLTQGRGSYTPRVQPTTRAYPQISRSGSSTTPRRPAKLKGLSSKVIERESGPLEAPILFDLGTSRRSEPGWCKWVRKTQPTTIGELRQSGYKVISVREEMRNNLVRHMERKDAMFQGIVGFEDTVIPQLENATLACQDLILLGERGQAKTRLLRGLGVAAGRADSRYRWLRDQ